MPIINRTSGKSLEDEIKERKRVSTSQEKTQLPNTDLTEQIKEKYSEDLQNQSRHCEQSAEIAADLAYRFDQQLKKVIEQRMDDMQKESDRLCADIAHSADKIVKLYKYLIAALIIASLSLATSAVAVFITILK